MKSRSDVITLFSTRIIRLFCYGFLSVILALYLVQAGLNEKQVGLLFTLTLAGDAGISLWLTTSADRLGRKRTLIVGALLMLGAGVLFIVTRDVLILMAAAIIGVISPSGNEIGPSYLWNKLPSVSCCRTTTVRKPLRGTTWSDPLPQPRERCLAAGLRSS
jgi:MFS family permease